MDHQGRQRDGERAEREETLLAVERTDRLTVEDHGLSLAEAKRLLATLQRSIVTVQIEEYGAGYRGCPDCHQRLPTKGTTGRPSVRRSVVCRFASDAGLGDALSHAAPPSRRECRRPPRRPQASRRGTRTRSDSPHSRRRTGAHATDRSRVWRAATTWLSATDRILADQDVASFDSDLAPHSDLGVT